MSKERELLERCCFSFWIIQRLDRIHYAIEIELCLADPEKKLEPLRYPEILKEFAWDPEAYERELALVSKRYPFR